MADSPRLRGGQSAPIPESLQRLWWAGGQSGPEGRTVRDRSRELAEALVGWRTVRPRWADGPPLHFKFCTRKVVSLVWAEKLNCGRSASEERTVRRLISKLFQRRC